MPVTVYATCVVAPGTLPAYGRARASIGSSKQVGVGKIVEKFIVADIERSYRDAATFTQRWIDNAGKV